MVTVVRTNLATDPRATDASRWFGSFGTGGAGTETMVSGASDGPLLPDGTRPTTYVRYTFTTANSGGNSTFGYNSAVPPSNAYPAGTTAGLAIYARSSRPASAAVRLYGRGLNAAGTQLDPSYSPAFSSAPAGQWIRVGMVHTASQPVGDWLPYAHFSGVLFQVGDTVDVVCALIDPDAVEVDPYFDGSTPDGPLLPDGSRLVYDWTGAANASTSTESLTDAVITASLITSAGSPPPVQIVLNGIPDGAEYVVTGSTGAGSSWPVPGGTGVGDGGQIVLVDNRSALNTPVTYSVVVQGVTYSAAPVVVEHPDENAVVLQSLDARASAAPTLLADSNFPLAPAMRVATFNVPRRSTPVTRWDSMTLGGTKFTVLCTPDQTRDLQAVLSSGAPIVIRSASQVRDLPAVQIAQVTSATSPQSYPDGGRKWELDLLYVDDPEPSRVLSAWTWADFNEAALVSFPTWADFNALFAGQTWADFDTTDWGQYQ